MITLKQLPLRELVIGVAGLISGISIYLLVKWGRKLKERRKELDRLTQIIAKRYAKLKEISNKRGRDLKQATEVKKLRKALEKEHNKNQDLAEEMKRLRKAQKKLPLVAQPAKKYMSMNRAKEDATDKIKQKYPALPKNQLERIEIERLIARSLMRINGGSFHISQILRKVEGIYTKHIKPSDRIMLLNEIKSWIERDPLCKSVSTNGNVQRYTFI